MNLMILALSLLLPASVDERADNLKSFYPTEFATIVEGAEANNCSDALPLCILFAIRNAENGRAGIEFGVLHPRAMDRPNSLRVQAGWAAATVSKNRKRWLDSNQDIDFITFLGNRYCPVGAENDPTGLNRHWIGNVRKFTERNLRAYWGHADNQEYRWATAREVNNR